MIMETERQPRMRENMLLGGEKTDRTLFNTSFYLNSLLLVKDEESLFCHPMLKNIHRHKIFTQKEDLSNIATSNLLKRFIILKRVSFGSLKHSAVIELCL